jgi:hypothetical protein
MAYSLIYLDDLVLLSLYFQLYPNSSLSWTDKSGWCDSEIYQIFVLHATLFFIKLLKNKVFPQFSSVSSLHLTAHGLWGSWF